MIKKQQMLRLKESRPRPFFDALHIEGEKRVFFIFHNRTLGAISKRKQKIVIYEMFRIFEPRYQAVLWFINQYSIGTVFVD